MKTFTLRLLRRLSVLALGVAIVLAVGPAALRWLGLVGPSLEQDLESVARALEVARSYGGGPGQDAFRSAADTLAEARELARRGERGSARRRAAVALEQARQAQRAALVRRPERAPRRPRACSP
jgi:hypothetical protein